MSKQKVIICNNLKQNLYTALSECPYDKLFVLVDEHTQHLCLPLINDCEGLKQAEVITIGAGDIHKNLETLAHVWGALGTRGATRHSLMKNFLPCSIFRICFPILSLALDFCCRNFSIGKNH